ncbi:hypothetical protein BGZ57DRAFT_893755 [Hyaloscypha finlandica]|nr:hypothetical protein BGZ57DRAFT_893755 [Hyaloscypha finlandica]
MFSTSKRLFNRAPFATRTTKFSTLVLWVLSATHLIHSSFASLCMRSMIHSSNSATQSGTRLLFRSAGDVHKFPIRL